MDNLFNYFRLLLLSASGSLLLCVIFAVNPELAHGIIMGKVCWFHFASLLFAISILFMEFTTRKSYFVFSLPDVLLLLTFGSILFTYDKELNLQPEKFMFCAQLIVLWFMLRAALQVHRELRIFYATIIIFTGIVTAIWGIQNLNENEPLTHPVFKMLKEAVSPEPFTGYVAVLLPVCLNTMLRFKNSSKSECWETRTFLFYLSSLGTILVVIVLSLRINSPAWVAAILSSAWVCWMRLIGWSRTRNWIKRHSCCFAVSSICFIFILTGMALWVSMAKSETGSQRLLIWNVTTKAIMERPLSGTGLGGFPVMYAQTQSAYFKSAIASDIEKQNAICPVYAKNEYLQIGLEFGIGGLLLFILWLAFSLYYGIKHRQIGSTGGIIALAAFAMYSYPLQIPSFCILLIFFTVICVTNPKQKLCPSKYSIPYIGALAALASCLLFMEQKNSYYAYKKWKTIQELHDNQAHYDAIQHYTELYPLLRHRVDFIMEGADCFCETGNHELAVQWLKHAVLLSADPDIYYKIALNEKAMGRYKEAECYLLDISDILPCKGYTYYLLTLLYAEPEFSQPEKMRNSAYKLLNLQSNPLSGVTESMKNEINNLLQKFAQ